MINVIPDEIAFNKGQLDLLTSDDQQEFLRRKSNYQSADYYQWLEACDKSQQYYFDAQFSGDKYNEAIDNNEDIFTLNRIYKTIDTLAGQLYSEAPNFQVISNTYPNLGTLYNRLYGYVHREERGDWVILQSITEALHSSVSYIQTKFDTYSKRVVNNLLHFDDVIVDSKSVDPLYRDAEYIYIKEVVPMSTIRDTYGVDDIIGDLENTGSWQTFNYRSSTGSSFFPYKLYDRDTDQFTLWHGYKKVHENGRCRIKIETMIGYKYVYSYYLPDLIQEYPITPMFTRYIQNPYRPSEVSFMIESQDYLNAIAQIALEVTKNLKPTMYVSERQAGGDLDAWTDANNNYGDIRILKNDPNAGAPSIVQSGQLSGGILNTMSLFINNLNQVGLPSDLAMYSKSPEKAFSLMQNIQVAQDNLKLISKNIKMSLTALGKTSIDFAVAYNDNANLVQILNISESANKANSLFQQGIDIRLTSGIRKYTGMLLQQNQEAAGGASQEATELDIELELADTMNDAEYVKAFEVLRTGTNNPLINIKLLDTSYSSLARLMNFSMLVQLRNSGVAVDDEDIISNTPIDNRIEISKKASTINKLRSAIVDLQAQIELLTNALQSSDSAVKQLKTSVEVDKVKHREEVAFKEHRANLRTEKSNFKTRTKALMSDAKNKVKAEIALAKQQISNEVDKVSRDISSVENNTEQQNPINIIDLEE